MPALPDSIVTIDCHYIMPHKASAYLIVEDGRAAFVDNNTTFAVPRLLAALEGQGLRPDDVDYVIITHVHLDHAGGSGALMAACPNATLLAHPKAARHVIDPARLIAGTIGVYGEEQFRQLYGEIGPVDAARVRIMKDGETLTWGGRTLMFFHTLGHASHHFSIFDSGSNSVFTGDSFGIGRSAHSRPGEPFLVCSSSPADFDGPEAHKSVDRIVATGAEWAYVGHFGPFRDLPVLAAQLHGSITQHEHVLRDALEQNLSGPDLVQFCVSGASAAMDSHFRAHGLATREEDLAWLAGDIVLNGQGLASVVERQRRKQASAS